MPYLRAVLENKDEDAMVRHESAEALGAIGDLGSLELLKELRDQKEEVKEVRETCEIAVARIEWENSVKGRKEKLRQRYISSTFEMRGMLTLAATLLQSTQRPRGHFWRKQRRWKHWRRSCLIRSCLYS